MSEYIVEDDFHAEAMGRFQSRADAVASLVRLAEVPFSELPNLPPCTTGERCRRAYWIIEYDTSSMPWKKLSAEGALTMTADSIVWSFKP